MQETEKRKIAPAVIKETKNVALYTVGGTLIMWLVFALLHTAMPEKIPFDYTVILGGLCGAAVAVLNFFLMGLTVQKVTETKDEDLARSRMRSSYTQRMMLQALWIIAAIVFPCFQFAAGLIPLLFPGAGIKLFGILKKKDPSSGA